MTAPATKLAVRLTAITCSLLLLAACSKTVQWEEEVLLNTGEKIWVKRTAVYTLRGGAGNPMDIAYRATKGASIEFNWNSKNYYYNGGAGIMVLAISPSGLPILVGKANDGSWASIHGYKCTLPFYVQFVPDVSGKIWTWPPKIENWLYNQPANLFREYGRPDGMLPRYTIKQKSGQSYLADPRLISMHKIDPAYTSDLCKRKER